MHNSWVTDATLYLLLFLSVLSWTVFLLKVLIFWRHARASRRFLETCWDKKEWGLLGAEACLKRPSDYASISKEGVSICKSYADLSSEGAQVKHELEILSASLNEHIKLLLRSHESFLVVLASIGAIAPLLGLFGTVWGIMEALIVIGETGEATLAVVAGPIGGALITTAVGIATAVPAVLFYNLFMRRLRVHATRLESFSQEFIRRALEHRVNWGKSANE